MRIGWIGLGAIGTAMVKSLLARGHEVIVYRRGQGLDAALAAGAKACDDYRALAQAAEAVGLCVFSDAQVREVMLDSGVLAAMAPGSVLAVHTTGSPKLMRELGAAAPEGVEVLDATFSGGAAGAEAAQLVLMVGGAEAALERVRPMVEAYCGQIFHMGALGNGQVVKLLNNLLLGTNQMFASEALRLADASGLDPALAARAIQASSGGSYAMNLMARGRDVEAAAAATRPYLVKDVAVAMAAARDAGLDVEAFGGVARFYAPDGAA